jgi:hypothetical protein
MTAQAEIVAPEVLTTFTRAEADVLVGLARCIQAGEFIPAISYRCRPEFTTARAVLPAVPDEPDEDQADGSDPDISAAGDLAAAGKSTPDAVALARAVRLIADGKFIAARAYRARPEFLAAVAKVERQLRLARDRRAS